MITLKQSWNRWKVWWLRALTGTAYGLFFRFIFGLPDQGRNQAEPFWIVTCGFLALVPFAMGYLGVRQYLTAPTTTDTRWWRWLFLPWISVLIMMLGLTAAKWEGAICLLFASPIMLAFSMLGGIAARIAWGHLQARSPGTVSAVILPILLIFVEHNIPSPYEIRTVDTQILIHAPANIVWDNIKSVHAILPTELPGSWVAKIGFPRPIEATLSHEGIGGVRNATFTGGLVFKETVNRWVPQSDLRFSIRADTNSIPPTTLDEHVTIGGQLFDILDGEYQLEQRPDGVLLHLSSHQRLSTHLNPYAGLWTEAVMRSIQNEILVVIRNRCETGAASGFRP